MEVRSGFDPAGYPKTSNTMLRFISVSCLVTAGLSTVVPVSLGLIAAAAMAETLKAATGEA